MTWDWSSKTKARLEAFLTAHGLTHGMLTIRRIGDGHSNLTYLITDGEQEVVVRRPPPPPVPPGAHDVLREARLIRALNQTQVPVPSVLAIAEAGEVLDVPFYVMSFIPGVVITERTPDALASPEHRRALATTLVDGLTELHGVDWNACGLSGFGRPEGFNRRHLDRIATLITGTNGVKDVRFTDIYSWLADTAPQESGATIIHNDYRLGNVMCSAEPPVRLLAILDWELATLGDPLLDLAYMLACYPEPDVPPTPTQDFARALLEPGFPSHAELKERYVERTGRDLTNLNWYLAMCHWKLAVLYEYSRQRGEDPYYQKPGLVDRFLEAARRATRDA